MSSLIFQSHAAVSMNWGGGGLLFVGVLMVGALLFGSSLGPMSFGNSPILDIEKGLEVPLS